MSLLGRLRAWWRETFGGGAVTGDSASTADAVAYDYECAVCGTGVDGPDESCPLCHSSDVVSAGAESGASPDPTEPSFGRDQYVSPGDESDASVARLRELRQQDELLERHADRWRRTEAGFVVETADGERVVDSREAVVALLRNEGVE